MGARRQLCVPGRPAAGSGQLDGDFPALFESPKEGQFEMATGYVRAFSRFINRND